MAMKPQCVQAVNQAAGRVLSDAELQAIDDRISSTMRRLASADPVRWRALSMDQRVTEAATTAMQDLQAQAARKLANVQRQVVATAATNQRIAALKQQYQQAGAAHALVKDIENTQLYVEGVKRQAVSELMDLVDAAASTQGASIGRKILQHLFDAQNPTMTRDLVAEIFGNAGGATGNAIAKAGARAWLDTIEGLRTRFNAAGGDVGKLAYGYLPQAHDSARIRQAGKQTWAARTLGLLDRRRYVREDGSQMGDIEVLDMLEAAHDTLASDGLNKQTPGQFKGTGARANRGSDSRVLHFKDGESYLQYNKQFGVGSMYDAMVAHVGGMARDIALIERYGSNPAQQFRLQNDLAKVADQGGKRVFGNKAQAYWDILSGATGTADSARIAQVGMHARAIQTFSKLGSAVISSITDLGTIMVTTGYNKLPYWDLVKNVARMAGSGEAREFAASHAIIADSMISDLNRWAGENIRNNWSGRIANSTMRLSLMNAWTDTLRRGFSLTMQQGLARMSGKKWADLTEWDRTHLQRKGITAEDWDVVNAAQLTKYEGAEFLTPEAIAASGHERAQEVTAKILGLITDESEYAVINPDMATKAIQTWGGTQAGTIKGELARAVMQFKSFPIAMISRHWRRMLDAPQVDGAPVLGNKLAYTAALLVSTTALGAIAFQMKQVVQGKDPVDMTTAKFWTRAAAQGGGAGFVADVLLGDSTEARSPLDHLAKLAGPTFSDLADMLELTKGNIDEALAGKETHLGAESARFARSHLPLVNLWYTKAAFDHMLTHAVQESLSPGYLARQRQKAQKDWKQGFWWEPGDTVPDRAPDLSAIGGR